MKTALLTHVGNGVDDREVSDPTTYPWTPDVAFLNAREFTGAGFGGVIATSTMTAGQSKRNTASVTAAGFIKSLVTGGITVSDSIGVNMDWDPIKNYDVLLMKAHANDLIVGKYTGNGTSQTPLSGAAFDYGLLFIIPESTQGTVIHLPDYPDASYQYINGTASLTNGVTPVSGGFSVGSAAPVNANGVVFHYIFIKEVAGIFEHVRVAGNGADDRAVANDSSFEPDLVMAKIGSTTTNWFWLWHSQEMGPTTDYTAFWNSDEGGDPNYIQELTATGTEIGSAASANSNGLNIDYFFLGIGDSDPPVVASNSIAALARRRYPF